MTNILPLPSVFGKQSNSLTQEMLLHASVVKLKSNKMCAWRHNMSPPLSSPVGAQTHRAPPNRSNVAVLSHAEYVPTLTAAAALRVKAALSKDL